MSGSWCFMSTLQCVQGLLETHQSKRTCGCNIMRLAISFFQSLSIILVESLKCSGTVLKTNSLKRFVSILLLPESEKAGRVCVCSSGDDAWELLLAESQEIRREGKTSISSGKEGQDSRDYQFECRYLSSTQMVLLVIFGILPQESPNNWRKMPKINVETPL